MLNDFYSKLNEQEKKIFYAAVVIVMFMVLDRMFLGPAFSKMKAYDEEIEQQRINIKRDLRFISYKNQILDEDRALRPYYKNTYKTEEQIIAAFLKKVEMIATEEKINLIKITPAESKERKGFTEYYANLECEGLLENVAAFMHAIDTSEDLLKITKVSFSLKRASGDEVVVGMEISKMLMGSRLAPQAEEEKASAAGAGVTGSGVAGSGAASSDAGANEGSGSGAGAEAGGDQAQSDGPSGAQGPGSGKDVQQQDEKTLQMPSGHGGDEDVSQRYQMKGSLLTEKDQKKLEEAAAKEPPLKKSIYEKILERSGAANAEDALTEGE